MADQIRYDLLTQQALRGVVRSVLSDAAKKGLAGEHHFYVAFKTDAPGVALSKRLKEKYPTAQTSVFHSTRFNVTEAEYDKAKFETWLKGLDAVVAAVGD